MNHKPLDRSVCASSAFNHWLIIGCLTAGTLLFSWNSSTASTQEKITHSFLALGANTYIVSESGNIEWKYPFGTRDGWVLPDRHLLLALSKCDEYPGGAAVEVTFEGKILWEYRGNQAEVNTVEKLEKGNFLVSEAGPEPRLLEVNSKGKVVATIPLTCQSTNHHMESRMARKLPNGDYLVPQLLDKVVREYTPKGKIVWEVNTPNWAFTAIRLPNGHTLIDCTVGNAIVEVNSEGKTVWQLSNDDLPKALISDACGGQRLPNGNTVFTSYRIGADRTKLVEVTPDKKVVWTYTDDFKEGIHEFQILSTNGKRLEGPARR